MSIALDVGVVMLGPDEFGIRRMARHQFARLLARRFPVVWVDPPPSARTVLRTGFRRAAVAETIDGVDVWRPGAFHARLDRFAVSARLQAGRRLRHAVGRLRARGATRIVLYLWRPDVASLESWGGPTVYHISDEYTFSEVEVPIPDAERHVIENVDRVFVHSPAMLDKKGGLNPATELVPNGVDYAAFSADHAEPADLAAVPRPRIGYVGVLKKQLDWALMRDLVSRNREWRFCFVGPVNHREQIGSLLDEIERAPNAVLLGDKPAAQLPAYTAHLDVGLMPYRVNDYTRYIYPLKLHEYLAAGRPVVSTPIPAVAPFADLVEVADGSEAFEAAIERALGPTARSAASVQARRAVARQHDWTRLVTRVADRIVELACGQPGPAP